MEGNNIFISSVSRRDLARRRPVRPIVPVQLVVALIVLAIAAGALVLARGGI